MQIVGALATGAAWSGKYQFLSERYARPSAQAEATTRLNREEVDRLLTLSRELPQPTWTDARAAAYFGADAPARQAAGRDSTWALWQAAQQAGTPLTPARIAAWETLEDLRDQLTPPEYVLAQAQIQGRDPADMWQTLLGERYGTIAEALRQAKAGWGQEA